jgi:hypothetical protein
MSTSIEEKSWKNEKEELKLKFEVITNRYAMFEEGDNSVMSEKLQLKLAKTKEELHKIIAAL